MTFRVGMKVVCVDDSSWEGFGCIRKGEVYEVADVFTRHGSLRLSLLELPTILNAGYYASRFRPAVSPGISFDTSIPADPDSEQHDNRRRVAEPAWGASA